MNNEQSEWNDFVLQNGGSFLQSFEWGEFQESLGRKVWRIKNDFFQALIIQHRLPFGRSYLYCPRGPIITNNTQQTINNFLEEIKKIVKQEGAIFLRVDPEWGIEDGNILNKFGFRKSFKEIQPKRTLILDLVKSENDILAEMHQKTRYNIRVAERHGIKILNPKSEIRKKSQIQNPNDQNFETFWKLLQQTAKRDKFRPHPEEHYQKLLKILSEVEPPKEVGPPDIVLTLGDPTSQNKKAIAKLFLADYQGKVIAVNILIFFGKRATYLHGASDFEYRNLMAPYLLHWQQILEAKKLGCSEYDFWGIDEKKWPGLTRFKKGFGGKELEYIGAWDLVFDKKLYQVYKTANFLTGILKRL